MALTPQLTARQAGGFNANPQAINMGATTQMPSYNTQFGGMPLTGLAGRPNMPVTSSAVPFQLRQQYLTSNQPASPLRPVAPTPMAPAQLSPQQQAINSMVKTLIGQGMSVQQAQQHAQQFAGTNPGVTAQPVNNATRLGYGMPTASNTLMPTPGVGPQAGAYHPTSFFNPNALQGRVVGGSPF